MKLPRFRMAQRPVAHPALPLLLILLWVGFFFSNLVAAGFARLGLPRPVTMLVLLASITGSVINIPLRRRLRVSTPGVLTPIGPWLYYRPPQVEEQVLAINVGGALVPTALSIWLLWHAPLWKIALAIALVAAITHRFARPLPGVGITMPVLLPPIIAGALGWLLAGAGGPQAAAIAYAGGSLGSLIGADLLNLGKLQQLGPGVVSIGGAGIFDGVFLVGLVAALLT